ncbi:MAG: TonB-dependent receptor [Caulobacteraceae bacterium]
MTFRPDEHWVLNGAATYTHAKLTSNYCEGDVTSCPPYDAPSGTQLPVTPKFKANATARYNFPLGTFDAHLQGSVVYQSSNWPNLIYEDRDIVGKIPGYTTFDFTAGNATGRLDPGAGGAERLRRARPERPLHRVRHRDLRQPGLCDPDPPPPDRPEGRREVLIGGSRLPLRQPSASCRGFLPPLLRSSMEGRKAGGERDPRHEAEGDGCGVASLPQARPAHTRLGHEDLAFHQLARGAQQGGAADGDLVPRSTPRPCRR